MNKVTLGVTVIEHQLVKYENKNPNNPALSYLLRLRSKKSQKTMRSCLSTVVRIFGWDEPLTFNWSGLTRDMVQGVIQKLLHDNKTPNTINLILCAIKGVAEEARASRSIDADTYHDIKAVKRVRGVRVSRGKMLERSEIKRIL
ncbi:integrase, partial [Escherichia coli]|nr:integrase [Escherichia coli]